MYRNASFVRKPKLINVLPHRKISKTKKSKIKKCSFAQVLCVRKMDEEIICDF